jgi:hypothetical protein
MRNGRICPETQNQQGLLAQVELRHIGPAFQAQYLPAGGMIDIMDGIGDRVVMLPGPSPLLAGRAFEVRAAMASIVTDLLEIHVPSFIEDVCSLRPGPNTLSEALPSRKVKVIIKKGADQGHTRVIERRWGRTPSRHGHSEDLLRARWLRLVAFLFGNGIKWPRAPPNSSSPTRCQTPYCGPGADGIGQLMEFHTVPKSNLTLNSPRF